jgi:beta-N-acetylhexosaminidase
MNTPFLFADIAGTHLTSEDKEILAHPAIAGLILFARNYESVDQLKALTDAIRAVKGPMFIAVDQEGGRVQRFESGFTALPSMRTWGHAFDRDYETAKKDLQKTVRTMSDELAACGVNLNLFPVLDLDDNKSTVIGERSFGTTAEQVIARARPALEALHAGDYWSVGKHFPGHGGVVEDSHFELPVDPRPLDELLETDLKPFVALHTHLDFVMSAHVLFPAVDNKPPTFSSVWLHDILRDRIGFEGLVISDDLNMKGALDIGGPADRADSALYAGCDLLLCCNNRDALYVTLNEYQHLTDRPERQQRMKQCPII